MSNEHIKNRRCILLMGIGCKHIMMGRLNHHRRHAMLFFQPFSSSSDTPLPPHTTTTTLLTSASAGLAPWIRPVVHTAASAAPQAGSTRNRWSSANFKHASTAWRSETTTEYILWVRELSNAVRETV